LVQLWSIIIEPMAKAKPRKIKKALLIIAPEDFRDEELFDTRKVLEGAGIKTEVVSSKTGMIKGSQGGTEKVSRPLFEANVADYGAIIFVGGRGASVYFNDAIALAMAEEAVRQGKIVGAICIAPSILANAGVLMGKKATAFPSEKGNLISKGADYLQDPVVVDGQIVTASGPQAAKDFGWKIVELLS